MSSSKILFFLCLSFIFGIFIESLIKTNSIFIWGILFLSIGLALFSPWFNLVYRKYILVLSFCLLFFILGTLRMQISEFNIANNKLAKLNGREQVVLTGVVFDEPDVRYNFQKIKVKIGDSVVLITTDKYPEYKYLDEIKITGRLEVPFETEEFSYKNYLLKDHIYSVMYFPKIEIISRDHKYSLATFLYEKILILKQKIRKNIQTNFFPPQSEILQGIILGDNGAMSVELKNKLNITGLRHIIAVSGTHVIILVSIVMSLLLILGFYRNQAFYVTLIFVFTYIILTGLPPSGVRAGIMGAFYLLAQKLGRQGAGSRTVVIVCAVMLAANPLLLFYDVGFQLSFLAVMGLIYLEPFFKDAIKKLTKDKFENTVDIVSATLSAQVFTLPIMVYNFSNISFVSPITNLLVLPIVYWLMIFGFLLAFSGIFSSAIAWILSIPCWILLTYFVQIINIFSQPWAVKVVKNVHGFWLLISYLIIGSVVYFFKKRAKQEFL